MEEKQFKFNPNQLETQSQLVKDGLNRTLEIAISNFQVNELLDEFLKELQKSSDLPGFRQGKVPLQVIKNRVGNEARFSIIKDIIEACMSEKIESEKVELLGTPEVQFDSLNKEFAATAKVYYGVKPHCPEPNLSNIKLTRYVPDKDQLLEEITEDFLYEHAERVPYDSEYSAQLGDWIELHCWIQPSEPTSENYGSKEHKTLEFRIDHTNMIFGKKFCLLGFKPNDGFTLELIDPINIKRKPWKIEVQVVGIYQKIKANKDLELANKYNFKSVEELDKVLLNRKLLQFTFLSQKVFETQFEQELIKDLSIELPHIAVIEQMRYAWSNLGYDQSEGNELEHSVDESESQENSVRSYGLIEGKYPWDNADEEHLDRFIASSKSNVIRSLVFSNFTRKNEISISEDELENKFNTQKAWLLEEQNRLQGNTAKVINFDEFKFTDLDKKLLHELYKDAMVTKVKQEMLKLIPQSEEIISFAELTKINTSLQDKIF